MVLLGRVLCSAKKTSKSFMDNLRVYVKGGGGGLGLPKYGGVGGRGGHVYFVGNENVSLKAIRSKYPNKRFVGGQGKHSSGKSLLGAPGEDLEIEVPVGVTVRTDDGFVFGDINNGGEKVLAARGGKGGGPENNFQGEVGDAFNVNLDLKLIADIGLVGGNIMDVSFIGMITKNHPLFPNAGKSTLLAALSRARPKIASYPFTTIQPQLGTMVYDDHRQISVADLPGLIEGAHVNVGMGHKFLKHIERTKLLMFVVDIYGFRLSSRHVLRSPVENIILLNKELELYREDLVTKPAVLVLNKIDIEGSQDILDGLLKDVKILEDKVSDMEEEFRPGHVMQFDDVFCISAKHQQNIDSLKQRLRELLDLYADLEYDKKFSLDFKKLEDSSKEQHGNRNV